MVNNRVTLNLPVVSIANFLWNLLTIEGRMMVELDTCIDVVAPLPLLTLRNR
jgi:hypothetical protein